MGGENCISAREIYKIVFRNHADTERNLFPINYIYVSSFLQICIMLISAGLYSFHPGKVLLHGCLWESIPLLQYKRHPWKYWAFPAQTAPAFTLAQGGFLVTLLSSLIVQTPSAFSLTTPTHTSWSLAWGKLCCIRIMLLISSSLTFHSHRHDFSPQGDSHPPFPGGKLRRTLGMTWQVRRLKGFQVFGLSFQIPVIGDS